MTTTPVVTVPLLVRDRTALAEARDRLAGRVAVVMTMGALHQGHAALVSAAAAVADSVVVTVFVNPLQFGAGEDLDRYPRTLEADLAVCSAAGADVVYAPGVAEVYPRPAEVTVSPGSAGEILEGGHRPGHFAGVLTVVCKLLHQVRPDVALFGEKDYQQLVLVRRMVRDLDLPVAVLGLPTVRDDDGLALSSRNRYLSTAERQRALALSAALRAGGRAAGQGAGAVLQAARAVLDREPDVAVDYLALTGPDLEPEPPGDTARLLVAARVGTTRLIDNVAVTGLATAPPEEAWAGAPPPAPRPRTVPEQSASAEGEEHGR